MNTTDLVSQLLSRSQPMKLLTVPQVADRLAVSTRTVYRMVAEGQLETVKVRGCTRIVQDSVARFVDPGGGGS